MKEKLLLLKLSLTMAVMFFKEFYKESKREVKDSESYPQCNYDTCIERAMDILSSAFKKVSNYYALTIAVHREEFHNENRQEEIKEVSTELTEKEQSSATRGFWLM